MDAVSEARAPHHGHDGGHGHGHPHGHEHEHRHGDWEGGSLASPGAAAGGAVLAAATASPSAAAGQVPVTWSPTSPTSGAPRSPSCKAAPRNSSRSGTGIGLAV